MLTALVGCAGEATSAATPNRAAPQGTAARTTPETNPTAPDETLPAQPVHDVHVDVLIRPKDRRFWLYQPKPLPQSPALVLIAPAGVNQLVGRELSADDRAEHLPYVRAGFVVMAYNLDGHVSPGASDAQFTSALVAYKSADAGLANARAAIALAAERVPSLDTTKIFAAGRGAAGSHALLLAADEPRVKGAVVYAPATRFVGDKAAVMAIDKAISGYGTFIRRSMPENRVADVRAPLFIYQSRTDEVIRASHTQDYVERLKRHGKQVDFVTVTGGAHYEGMLSDGIPRGHTVAPSAGRLILRGILFSAQSHEDASRQFLHHRLSRHPRPGIAQLCKPPRR